jgi:hypothetical protein
LPEKGRKETERGTASAAPLSVQNQTKRQIPWQNPGKIAWQMTPRNTQEQNWLWMVR